LALGPAITEALQVAGLGAPAAQRWGSLISELVPDGGEHPGWHRVSMRLEAGRLEARMRPPGGADGTPAGVEVHPGLRRDAGPTVRPGRRRGNEIELVAEAAELAGRVASPLEAGPGPALPAERDGFLLGALAVALTEGQRLDPEALAGAIGAAAARGAAAAAQERRGGTPPASPADVAEAFVDYQRSVGGDWRWARTDRGPIELSNRACPFGATARDHPELCGVTRSFLRTLADAVVPDAEITLDERLAIGDRRCRITLHVAPTPPASPRRWKGLELSLRLPRRRSSVVVARHLVRAALEGLGAPAVATDDIVLALSEACANAVRHAGRGAEYSLGLRVEDGRCRIDVTDTGRGFQAAPAAPVRIDAEGGRGLALMRVLMDDVAVASTSETGTRVTMDKRLGPAPDAGRLWPPTQGSA
jgi:serine/threonine-protein kinase RsbW